MRLKWMIPPLCAVALTACGDAGLKTKDADASGGAAAAMAGPGPYRAFVVDNAGQVVSVWYEKRGDLAVAQDDMILGTHAEIQAGNQALLQALLAESGGGGEKDAAKRKAAIEARQGIFGLGSKSRWPNGVVIYELDASLPAAMVANVNAAVTRINAEAIIAIKAKTDDDKGPTLKIQPSADAKTCEATIGYVTTGMNMKLGASCSEWTVVHEFLHSAGLQHEQGRSDRLSYMKIDVSNIIDGKKHNFAEWKLGDIYNTLYDFCSVMHYPAKYPKDWAVNAKEGIWMTLNDAGIEALEKCSTGLSDECAAKAPGQRCAISRGDKATLKAMYKVAGVAGG